MLVICIDSHKTSHLKKALTKKKKKKKLTKCTESLTKLKHPRDCNLICLRFIVVLFKIE